MSFMAPRGKILKALFLICIPGYHVDFSNHIYMYTKGSRNILVLFHHTTIQIKNGNIGNIAEIQPIFFLLIISDSLAL